MCYPTAVLIHVYLRDVTDDQLATLTATPGLSCRRAEDTVRVRIELAHDVPSWPDLEVLETRFRGLLAEVAPGATIVDVRVGCRYDTDFSSPAQAALHRLRSILDSVPPDHRDENLVRAAREFAVVDRWMCEGATPPSDWARRAPGVDRELERLLATEPQQPVTTTG